MSQAQPRTLAGAIDKDDRPTPIALFDKLNREFGFTLDAAASPENALCERFLSREDDALKQPWTGSVWCNPPYGIHIGKWVEKGFNEAQHGAVVVMLLPANTDTLWFHRWCTKGEIRFIKGRLKFGSMGTAAPFPSMVVIFRPIFATLDLGVLL